MNNCKNILLAGICMIALLSSCSKSFLDTKPYTSLPPGDALATETDVLNALRGTYAELRDLNVYGRTLPVFGDLYADNIFISIRNSGSYLPFDSYVITRDNGDFTGMWQTAYITILRANNVIDAALPASANVNQYKGEAYALRALMYFNLVRIFARPYTYDSSMLGVPIVLHYDTKVMPKRSSIDQVYKQIVADLEQAYALQNQYFGSARFSKYAARALEAKVCLYMRQNRKALDYANEVIGSSGFSLLQKAELAAYWDNPASNDASVKKETLFEASADATLNISANELAGIYSQESSGYMLANETLYALYSSQDVRKSLITVGARVGGENPAWIVTKLHHFTGDVDDKKIMRMSEVYLIAAEAANRLNDDPQALTLLNALMAQRDASLTYTSAGSQLLDDIINERRKELAFEGDRYHDYNRLQKDLVRVGGNYTIRNVPFLDYRRIAPIPLAERNANPGIEQNPKYEQ